MIIGYINFQMNAFETKPPTKQPDVVDIKALYNRLRGMMPIVTDKLVINEVLVCASNELCNPKKNTKHKDFLVAMKDLNTNIKTALSNNNTKYIVLILNGFHKDGDKQGSFHLRIPKSGYARFTVGMSDINSISILNSNVENKIQNFGRSITNEIHQICGNQLPNERPTKIITMTAHKYNVFGTQKQKIKNFIQVLKEIDKLLPTHELDYFKKETKTINRGNFKPQDKSLGYPTIGITQWGMVDFLGGKKPALVNQCYHMFRAAFSQVLASGIVQIDKDAKYTEQSKKLTGCPKGVTQANTNQKCPEGYIPLPNKTKTVCCYKKKLTKATYNEAIKKFKDAGIPLPKIYTDKYGIPNNNNNNSKTKTNVPYKEQKLLMYKGKKFNCMSLLKNELQQIAIVLKLNPKGFKKDLCDRIISHY